MFRNAVLLALRELRRNLMRSSLTILGVVIGVAAVIVMVTLGGGTTAAVADSIASMGSNRLIVSPGQRQGPGGSWGVAVPFDADDADALREELPSLAAVAPSSGKAMNVISGNENWRTSVTGTTNEYLTVTNLEIGAGRQFLEAELRAGKAVCIIGATVRDELYGMQNPLGSSIRLERLSCEIVGLIATKGGTSLGQDPDDAVLVPLRTFQRRIGGTADVQQIQISVRDGISTAKAQDDIMRLMRERRHIGVSDSDDFSILDMADIATTLTSTTTLLTMLLGAVAAVSLLVGGIGIMNIMLVSVTERTREIGIRLAIGALEREVLAQFLIEAVVLSIFGGVIGIVIALSGSVVLTRMLSVPLIIDPGIIALAFLFSATVGVLFGYFPARKAARLDPIEALHHE